MRSLLATIAVIALLACGESSQFYEAKGLVEEVQPENRQVVISHEDIEGFMPAMTMNFDVSDEALLESLAPGQQIDFTIEFNGRSYRVVKAVVTGEAGEKEGWVRLGAGLVRTDPAPEFALVDQQGEAFGLADLAGKVVLMDFIYTNCPGPCPILSRNLVNVQKQLGSEGNAGVWFVSVTLDPEVDTPEVLRAYAEKHGMDLANWSLLTGDAATVADVVKRYGVGSVRAADGVTIDHRVATFLIDDEGRIARRYFGLEHRPEDMAADIQALAG